MMHYSLTKLSRAVGIGEDRLRAWIKAGWLKGARMGGVHPRFTMQDFLIAKELSEKPSINLKSRDYKPEKISKQLSKQLDFDLAMLQAIQGK